MDKDVSKVDIPPFQSSSGIVIPEPKKEYLRQCGFKGAASHDADPNSLRECLAAVYDDYKQGTKSKEKECRDRIEELKATNENLQRENNDTKEKDIKPKEDAIKRLTFELSDIDLHPEKYEIESEFSLIGFLIGSVLLLLLSIYLIIFYSSSSYSAFVKNLGTDLQSTVSDQGISVLFNTIFDPNAWYEASEAGSFALLMTILFPTVFVSMGFLLHVFSSKKQHTSHKFLRMGSLLLVVLAADIIIAYKITEGIYEAKFLTGLTEATWKFSMVWEDVNFYLVILAGFAAYIIWGILLNYVIEENKNRRYVRGAKKRRQDEIKNLELEIKKSESLINENENTTNTNEAEIGKLERLLKAQIISLDDLFSKLDTYFNGWSGYIHGLFMDDDHPEATRKMKAGKVELEKYKDWIASGLTPTGAINTIIE